MPIADVGRSGQPPPQRPCPSSRAARAGARRGLPKAGRGSRAGMSERSGLPARGVARTRSGGRNRQPLQAPPAVTTSPHKAASPGATVIANRTEGAWHHHGAPPYALRTKTSRHPAPPPRTSPRLSPPSPGQPKLARPLHSPTSTANGGRHPPPLRRHKEQRRSAAPWRALRAPGPRNVFFCPRPAPAPPVRGRERGKRGLCEMPRGQTAPLPGGQAEGAARS